MSRSAILATTAALSLLVAPPRAQACSMCRCGDPTFMLVGSQIFVPNAWRVNLDAGRFEKSQGVEGDPDAAETETEDRYGFSVTRSFGRQVTLVASLPFSDRTIRSAEGSQSLSGLSNPELLGTVRLGAAAGRPGTWLAFSGGILLPWGKSAGQIDGERAEEHVQPSTGAWGGLGGLSFSHLAGDAADVFGSVLGRVNGRNDFGYHYGNAVFVNLAYERRLVKRLNGVVELNYRWAGKDEVEPGATDPNTGGSVLYVAPRIIVMIGKGLYFRAAVQIPIAQGLYGIQDEKTNVLIGLMTRF